MKKISETELKNKVESLRQTISEVWYNPATWSAAGGGNTGGGAATGNPHLAAQGKRAGATQQGTKPAAPAKVAYDTNFPEATAKELQTKLNAAGEKLTVDGKMGPATRAAMARHPEITTQPAAAQAVGADINSADNTPAAPAPAPAPAAPTGSAALNPNAPGANAATTIPSGGLENQANQAQAPAAPATAPAAPATAAGPAPGTVGTGSGGQLVDGSGKPVQQGSTQQPAQVGESTMYDDLKRIVSLVHYR